MNRSESRAVSGGHVAARRGEKSLPASQRRIEIDGDRLNRQLRTLSQIGRSVSGGVTRLAYSDDDLHARSMVTQWMLEARLAPSVDSAGNIIGRRAGIDASLKPLVLGSHIDTVPDGGMFDGTTGTLAAIEAARTLAELGVATRHPLEIAVWANEEGGMYGSRAVSGQLNAAELAHLSGSGVSIAEGIARLGGDPSRLSEAVRSEGDVAGYLELHIEQGGILDSRDVDIGIVLGIVGIHQYEVTIDGIANHAGTTPMEGRRDALVAAGRFVDMVNRVVGGSRGGAVGTVGELKVFPGAPNVIPGRVLCTLELRDLDDRNSDSLADRIRAEARKIGQATGTTFSFSGIHSTKPALCDPLMRACIAEAALDAQLTTLELASGAGHDAQAIARLGPIGMVFIPSAGGISHSPGEFSREEDVVNGANVLLGALLAADEALP